MHLLCVKIYSDSANLVLLLIRNFFVQLKNSEMKQNFLEKNPNNILLIYNTFQLGRFQSFFSVLNTAVLCTLVSVLCTLVSVLCTLVEAASLLLLAIPRKGECE
jgi:hypothetical protein